ncbi:MAG: carboxymuconolactone decarboxylase family protein [Candidatus Thiodiazotropha sp.]
MRNSKQLLGRLLAVLTGSIAQPGLAEDAGQIHYPAGSQPSFSGPAEYFTGEVQVQMLFPETAHSAFSGAYVTFQPGARTHWHYHPAGQHMIVTDGTALTGTRDGHIVEFSEGETVWCPSDIDHWHGATPDAPMTHLVITGSLDGKNVVWKEKVSDEQYYAGKSSFERKAGDASALSQPVQRIAPIAAFTASGRQEALRAALEQGLDAGLTVNEIKEVLIHLYAYVGFPRALNGLATFMALVEERKAQGIEDETGPEATPLPADKSSLELGKAVQTRLSGKPVTGPLFDFAPAINTFLQSHLFGDLFGRGILDEQSREIATLSALASLDGVESQLQAHVRIATNVGLSREQLLALASVLGDTVGRQEGHRVQGAIETVLPEQSGSQKRDA